MNGKPAVDIPLLMNWQYNEQIGHCTVHSDGSVDIHVDANFGPKLFGVNEENFMNAFCISYVPVPAVKQP